MSCGCDRKGDDAVQHSKNCLMNETEFGTAGAFGQEPTVLDNAWFNGLCFFTNSSDKTEGFYRAPQEGTCDKTP
jgi:hypothetical protein